MVCTRGQDTTSKIAGGFVLIPTGRLRTAWRTCRSRPQAPADFRTWLACYEMVARRAVLSRRTPTFSYGELARLLGVTERRARASVRRIVAAGLVEWSEAAIVFPSLPGSDAHLEDTIGRGRGWVALPRRILRFLAAGARPALIATTLAVLLRCLSRRRSGWDGRGRLKASWVARTFGVSLRQAQAARAELIAVGWIAPEEADQWALNRWGRAYRIDLAWTAPGSRPARVRRSPGPIPGALSAHPDLQTGIPPGGERNQEPARRGGPDGVQVGEGRADRPRWPEQATSPAEAEAEVVRRPDPAGNLPAPDLREIRPEDFADVGRLLELHRQAVVRKLASPSEDGRLMFLALAEHARAVGKNPGALLANLMARGAWAFATAAEEDAARRRLRLHEFGRGTVRVATMTVLKPSGGQGISDDVRIVRAVRAASIRAGIYRDPWPAFARLNPGWTRDRWDTAVHG